MLLTHLSLAILGTTLVSASSDSSTGNRNVARGEHAEKELLEGAAQGQKMVKALRRRDHGPRRQDTQHLKFKKDTIPLDIKLDLGNGQPPLAVVKGGVNVLANKEVVGVDVDADVLPTEHPAPPPAPPASPAAPAPTPKADIPININADLLGKPLANVQGAVNLGLKNLGLNLNKKDTLPILANVDLLGKPLAVVDGVVNVANEPEELLGITLTADVLPTPTHTHRVAPADRPTPAASHPDIPIKVDADLAGKPLVDVNGNVNLANLQQALDLDLDVSILGHNLEKRSQPVEAPVQQSILADFDVNVGSSNGHRRVGGLSLDVLKTRTQALAAIIDAHLTDQHDDCSLDDVSQALSALISGLDHAVFRRKL